MKKIFVITRSSNVSGQPDFHHTNEAAYTSFDEAKDAVQMISEAIMKGTSGYFSDGVKPVFEGADEFAHEHLFVTFSWIHPETAEQCYTKFYVAPVDLHM